jgi:transposase-like protein
MANESVSRQAPLSKEQLLEYAAGLFGDQPDNLKHLVETICQQVLEAEITEHLGAKVHQRTPARRGHRNGYKPRTLNTRAGTLHLSVPQARDCSFSSRLFENYQRSEQAVRLALMETVLQGVSTRRVNRITEAMCGASFSAGTVSNLMKSLDEALERFRNRALSGCYPYLVVDARYEKIRGRDGVCSRAVLIVAGVSDDGYREVLSVEIADLESESTWRDVFRRLKARGLTGVGYIASDNHKGIKTAVRKEFSGALWQRCRVHFIRNITGLVPLKERAQLVKALHYIWAAESQPEARRRTGLVVELYQAHKPRIADYLEVQIEDTLAVLALPDNHRVRMATNNLLERLSQTIRQRTRVVRIFPNEASALRLITAVLQEVHEDWTTGHRYLTFSKSVPENTPGDYPDVLLGEQQAALDEKLEKLLAAEIAA